MHKMLLRLLPPLPKMLLTLLIKQLRLLNKLLPSLKIQMPLQLLLLNNMKPHIHNQKNNNKLKRVNLLKENK